MRKWFLALIMCLFTMPSCDLFAPKMIAYGNDSNTTTIALTHDDLSYKVSQKESFILLISNDTCTSCQEFKTIIDSYIKETYINIYEIDYKDCISTIRYSLTPALIFIINGIQIKTHNYSNKDNTFRSADGLKDTINKQIYGINMIEKSEDSIDKMIENQETFVLYIGWNKCGDCSLLKSEVLDSYLKKKMNKPLIYLESDKYRSLKPKANPNLDPTNEEQIKWDNWINFATKYHFVDYENGKVPALVYYENGVFKDYLVYHNDVRTDETFTISFFEELVGQTMSDEQYINYHNKKATEFLKKYL